MRHDDFAFCSLLSFVLSCFVVVVVVVVVVVCRERSLSRRFPLFLFDFL